MNKNKYEDNVPYIVYMKENSHLGQGKYQKFCGYLVNNSAGSFYFEINGNRMLLIVPHNDIKYMYPSSIQLDIYNKRLQKENNK